MFKNNNTTVGVIPILTSFNKLQKPSSSILVFSHPLRNPKKKKKLNPTSTPLPQLSWKLIKVTRLKLIMLTIPRPPNLMIMMMTMIRSLRVLPRIQDLQAKILQILQHCQNSEKMLPLLSPKLTRSIRKLQDLIQRFTKRLQVFTPSQKSSINIFPRSKVLLPQNWTEPISSTNSFPSGLSTL